MLPTINKHHKIAYLYLQHMQLIALMLGHKKNKTFIIYIPSINNVKITCFKKFCELLYVIWQILQINPIML